MLRLTRVMDELFGQCLPLGGFRSCPPSTTARIEVDRDTDRTATDPGYRGVEKTDAGDRVSGELAR